MGWDGFAFFGPSLRPVRSEARTVTPLATHKCGTCFFFQEAGFAGNGWCLHADRAKSADVRTLVRRNELACRNDWGQSLWTDPKQAAETGAARKLITAQAERPATEGEIGFMVNPRDGQADARPRADRTDRPADDAPTGEDVVVGQITVMPPGMTGRRRLVDQVPVELPTRDIFGASADPDDVPHAAAASEPLPTRPGRPIEVPADHESTDRTVAGRDRNRPQRVLPRSTDRAGAGQAGVSTERRAPAETTNPDEFPPRRRDRAVPGPQRRPDQDPADDRDAVSSMDTRDSSAPGRPVIASPDGSPARNGGQTGLDRELPRGVRPAPIPGPVPSRELRGGHVPEPRPIMSTDPRRQPDQRPVRSDEADVARRPSRPMPSPIMDESGSLSIGPPARSQPARRPALPDLSDDFFTRGAIPPVASGSGTGHVSASNEREERRSATRPMSDSTEVSRAHEPRPGRARPAVPKLGGEPEPQPRVAAPIPTVAEANQSGWASPTPPPAQPSRVAPAPRPDTGWAAPHPTMGESAQAGTQRPTMPRDASIDENREPARLEPPIPLRPEIADFGEYGGWFDLQSVEPRLAPELQRACETCRDFRPSENGERGWCTNRDAFTLRTVVNATDLPCISSFGCWWVPFDDLWLSEAAIRGHRNPTPLLDQTIGPEEELPTTARQRRRSQ